MVETVRILVVEDDEDQLEAYRDAAEEKNTNGCHIELVERESAPKAKEELLSKGFDGAIVDLNLFPGNPDEASGNEILLEITQKHRFPVLVVSGNLQNLDPSIQESGFLKTYNRDIPNDEIFDYLLKIHATGITRILGGRGLVERHLGKIFWHHLACDIDSWDAGNRESEQTLLRYTVAHLAEYLDIPDANNDGHYHEAEFYIIPPIRGHIATGDILQYEDKKYIVLSPPCDVAVRGENVGRPIINAKSIVLAPLIPLHRTSFVQEGLIHEGSGSDNAKGVKKLLEELIKGKREKYVFLPGYREIDPAVADLQNLCTWPLDKYLSAKRTATVSGAFLKDIQSRFASYYGRQGQPDLNKQELLKTPIPR